MKTKKKFIKQLYLSLILVFSIHSLSLSEIIGPWDILSSATSATFQSGNTTASINWINVNNVDISISEAFSGMSVIDDGLGNLPSGSIITMTFAPGTALNVPGADLVLFEAFNEGSYSLSTSYDGYGSSVSIPFSQFVFTGIEKEYYYGLDWGPFLTPVRGAPIDLSQLGVPIGQYVSEIQLVVTTAGADPLGIGSLSIPEPATLLLLGLGGLVMRRRGK